MTSQSIPKVLVIVGPTASGKTELAVHLAKQINGELVSADSRQVYKYLDLGTGKEGILQENNVAGSQLQQKYPVLRYIETIPQWLTDFVEPENQLTVAHYQQLAYEVVNEIIGRGKLPIIVGGTGLYIDALIEGYQFQPDQNRDPDNPRHAYGSANNNPPAWQTLVLGLDIERTELYQRIDSRLQKRIDLGLLEEIQQLLDRGISFERLDAFGLEYRYLAKLFQSPERYDAFGKQSPEVLATFDQLKFAIHAFARRQLTWFRHHGQVTWITSNKEAQKLVEDFFKS